MSSTPQRKRDAAETLEALERDAAEDEMDRILALGDAELDAELAQAGFDPGAERARGVRTGEEALRTVTAGAERPPRSAEVVPLGPPRRPSRAVWLVAAGFALLVGALAATEGAAIVAWIEGKPEPILPDDQAPRPPTPRETAEKLRDEADRACADRLFGRCKDRLDEAQKLDPAGEGEERVQRIRAAILDGTRIRPPPKDGPKK